MFRSLALATTLAVAVSFTVPYAMPETSQAAAQMMKKKKAKGKVMDPRKAGRMKTK